MAERRMYSKHVIDSDAFLDMPLSAQALYFHLSLSADDDGFLNNCRMLQRMTGAGEEDLQLLYDTGMLIRFPSGVAVITHWRIHNYIRSDRYKSTVYEEEKALLRVKENGAYALRTPEDPPEPRAGETACAPVRKGEDPQTPPAPKDGIPPVYQTDTQDRTGKERKGEDRTEKDRSDGKNGGQQPRPERKRRPDGAALCAAVEGMTKNQQLRNALKAFVQMREMIKKPMTEEALALLMTRLNAMSGDDETRTAIVNQSVLNNWQSVYPLKQSPPKAGQSGDLDGIL